MGGGGGGGGGQPINVPDNPATQFLVPFGQAIGTVGTGLTDWFGALKKEDTLAMKQMNPYISDMLNTAFDPQNELYKKTLGQVTDQTMSAEAGAGIAGTPYGVAAEGNAFSNFNIDWQNQKLQKEESALGSAAGSYGSLIGAGAMAAQPAEAALGGYTSGFGTSTQAQEVQNQLKVQAEIAQQQMQMQQQQMQNQASASKGGALSGALGGLMGM